MSTKTGILWVVATPIGNLDDFPPRARTVLAGCDVIAAEDTRNTGRLLAHFGIAGKQVSLHDHNEDTRVPRLIERLSAGESVALVSDAGTPLISDPGYRLVRAAHQAGIPVRAVPGPCAAIAALSIAGLPTDRFRFEGFLPARSAARDSRLRKLRAETGTLVFYETARRLPKTLASLVQVFGPDRPGALCRELTKLHETVLTGRLSEIADRLAAEPGQLRGEMVLAVAGAGETEDAGPDLQRGRELFELLREELPAGKAAKLASAWTGCRRQDLYR